MTIECDIKTKTSTTKDSLHSGTASMIMSLESHAIISDVIIFNKRQLAIKLLETIAMLFY